MLGFGIVTTETRDVITLPFGLSLVLTWAERESAPERRTA